MASPTSDRALASLRVSVFPCSILFAVQMERRMAMPVKPSATSSSTTPRVSVPQSALAPGFSTQFAVLMG
ncbi:hypothetical protein CBR_g45753 [Chara braunii]|uniref:Uncharacterized protein n=1 Tax=Chara braunii TaxID=69332 RepID=A0A388LZA7_CHABU|nr:hypothetical protein CBR_g45753 [Chara braunii]|eukprot:GBG87601.1 hypothetical protein CBR_g45753 [Chara braunii]